MTFLARNPNFLLLWVGQVLSQSGGRMYQMAMIWWLLGLGLSGPGKYVGFFMVMVALPSILLVRLIGKTIDRLSSRRILITADCLACATVGLVALLVWAKLLSLPILFLAGFAAACLQAFIDPTLNKAVQEVVPKEDTESAVSLVTSTQSIANFAGAVAGAMLIDRVGIAGTAALAALGYLASSSASWRARFQFRFERAESSSPMETGWRILAAYPLLKKILVGFGLINFFATPTLVVLPIYTKKTLLGTATTLGTLEAGLWLGLIAGALSASWVRGIESRIKLGALGCLIFGAGLSIPGFITSIPVYLAALFVSGTALGIVNVKFVSFFQEVIPDEIKGRFFALLQALVGFTFPIAYFAFGVLTDYVTPPNVCLLQGVGVIALAVFFSTLSRAESEAIVASARSGCE